MDVEADKSGINARFFSFTLSCQRYSGWSIIAIDRIGVSIWEMEIMKKIPGSEAGAGG